MSAGGLARARAASGFFRMLGAAMALALVNTAIAIAVALSIAACRRDEAAPIAAEPAAPPPAPTRAEPAAKSASAPAAAPSSPLADRIGTCVVVEGIASAAKIGPQLHVGDAAIGIVLEDDAQRSAWDEQPQGVRVRVEGEVQERGDLPVFVAREGEPMMAGIPVPEGTDLEAARKRLVIVARRITALRSPADVERDLSARVGGEVELTGVLWSRNGSWWFRHDGVDLHLDDREAIPEADTLHGRSVTLHGTLAREPRPRIDQIAVKPQPDLADAFVLKVTRASDPAPPSISACAPAQR